MRIDILLAPQWLPCQLWKGGSNNFLECLSPFRQIPVICPSTAFVRCRQCYQVSIVEAFSHGASAWLLIPAFLLWLCLKMWRIGVFSVETCLCKWQHLLLLIVTTWRSMTLFDANWRSLVSQRGSMSLHLILLFWFYSILHCSCECGQEKGGARLITRKVEEATPWPLLPTLLLLHSLGRPKK